MSSSKAGPAAATARTPAPLPALVIEIRARLEGFRDRVCAELRHYPMPIPACDVHFNRLPEVRSRVFGGLDRLDALGADPCHLDALVALVQSSVAFKDARKAELRRALARAADGA